MDKEKQIDKIIQRATKYAEKKFDTNFSITYAKEIEEHARRYIIGCNYTISSKELINYFTLSKRMSEDQLSY